MRSLALFFVVASALVLFNSSNAFAQADPDPDPDQPDQPVQPSEPDPVYPSISFSMSAGDAGCAKLDYGSSQGSFPDLKGGTVTQVRFYYATETANNVTEDSPFFEDPIDTSGYSPSPAQGEFCGLTTGTYFFKYGLVDTNGTMLEFEPKDDFAYGHTVDVQ